MYMLWPHIDALGVYQYNIEGDWRCGWAKTRHERKHEPEHIGGAQAERQLESWLTQRDRTPAD